MKRISKWVKMGELMDELIMWLNNSLKEEVLHPVLVIAVFVVVFLEIHPFQDGNGRLSRVLTTLLLLRSGYTYVPYSSLESLIEKSKEGYYLALRETQAGIRSSSPDWQPWILFFLKALRSQVLKLAKKVEREKLVVASLPELSLAIIDYLKEHGRVTISEMVRFTKANRNTLKVHFRNLQAKGYLVSHGQGRGSWYSLR